MDLAGKDTISNFLIFHWLSFILAGIANFYVFRSFAATAEENWIMNTLKCNEYYFDNVWHTKPSNRCYRQLKKKIHCIPSSGIYFFCKRHAAFYFEICLKKGVDKPFPTVNKAAHVHSDRKFDTSIWTNNQELKNIQSYVSTNLKWNLKCSCKKNVKKTLRIKRRNQVQFQNEIYAHAIYMLNDQMPQIHQMSCFIFKWRVSVIFIRYSATSAITKPLPWN